MYHSDFMPAINHLKPHNKKLAVCTRNLLNALDDIYMT